MYLKTGSIHFNILKIQKQFATWIRHQIKSLELEENVDYITFNTNSPAKESDTFMNDSQLHNHFLDFLYQANKITHEVNFIRHLSLKVDETHQSMSNFKAFITHRYEKIRGVSEFKIPTDTKSQNIFIQEEWQQSRNS